MGLVENLFGAQEAEVQAILEVLIFLKKHQEGKGETYIVMGSEYVHRGVTEYLNLGAKGEFKNTDRNELKTQSAVETDMGIVKRK